MHEQVIVIDISEEKNAPQVLINPQLLWASDERIKGDEGCLSVPGVYDGVERATAVRVRALDLDGKAREIEADGLLAVCIQHEMAHLEGVLFIDYLSRLKRDRAVQKVKKLVRSAA